MNISQGQVAKIIENMQKLKLQEMNTPDSIKYFDVWNFSGNNKERDQKILELYLVCYTEKEIAKKIHMDRTSVSKILDKVKNFIIEENYIIPDFLQIFNIWDFSICDSRFGRKYLGRMPEPSVPNFRP